LSSALTLLSLVIAFLGIIMLSLYASYEYSFDTFHKSKDDIYLFSFNKVPFVPAPLADELQRDIPEIQNAIVVSEWWDTELYKEEDNIQNAIGGEFLAVSADFFKMLDFKLIQGDKETVLVDPKSIVISEEYANKLFGKENPLGKYVNLGYRTGYKITGVMANMPKNSAFCSDALVSFASYLQPGDDWRGAQQWSEWSFHIFMQLTNATPRTSVEAKIEEHEKVIPYLEALEERSGIKTFVQIVPLADLHFTSGTFLLSTKWWLIYYYYWQLLLP